MGKLALLGLLALTRLPEPVAALWYAGRLRVVDGRRIDPKAQALGTLFNAVRKPGVVPTLAESRASLQMLAQKFDLPCPDTVTRRETVLPGADGDRPARIYDTRPDDADRPCLLFLHGGGWVQGGIDTHDGLCGQIARDAGVRVIALDYRLAPEHRFPAGLEDCEAAYRALRAEPARWGVDAARLAVGGDSAGGNLTAALMHLLAGRDLPRAQVLIYPAVSSTMDTPSMQAMRDAFVLPTDRVAWYLDQYLPAGQDRADPRLAPLNSSHLAGQPPAVIVHAGHDPLWDDGRLYAEALERAGCAVTLLPYPGQIHAFVSTRRAIPQGVDAVRRVSAWLKDRL